LGEIQKRATIKDCPYKRCTSLKREMLYLKYTQKNEARVSNVLFLLKNQMKKKQTVLIVDDNPKNLSFLGSFVAENGYLLL